MRETSISPGLRRVAAASEGINTIWERDRVGGGASHTGVSTFTKTMDAQSFPSIRIAYQMKMLPMLHWFNSTTFWHGGPFSEGGTSSGPYINNVLFLLYSAETTDHAKKEGYIRVLGVGNFLTISSYTIYILKVACLFISFIPPWKKWFCNGNKIRDNK